MMKALLALVLLCFPAIASAVPGYFQPFTRTPRDSTRLHVAWVVDDWAQVVDGANDGAAQVDAARTSLGAVKDRLERMGVEVHVYTYSQMVSEPRMWRFLGGTRSVDGYAPPGNSGGYAVAVLPYWLLQTNDAATGYRALNPANPTSPLRFTRPDSTTAVIVHYGGEGHVWNDGSNPAADSLTGCFTAPSGAHTVLGYKTNGDNVPQETQAIDSLCMALFSSPTDTMFSQYNPITRTPQSANRPTGHSIVKVVQTRPGQTDSVCAATGSVRDTLLFVWKLKSAGTGKSTWFVVSQDGISSSYGKTPCTSILWSVIARYVSVPMVKQTMEIADVYDWGGNPYYASWENSNGVRMVSPKNVMWPRVTFLDTVLTRLKTYNVNKVLMGTTADTLAYMWDNYPSYRRVGNPQVRWFTHDHVKGADTLKYGGRTYGDGVSNFWPDTATAQGRMVANRYDPDSSRFGTAQRLARADSIFAARGLEVSHFQLPGADRMFGAGTFDYTPYGKLYLSSAESLFTALANNRTNYVAGMAVANDAAAVSASAQATRSGHRWQVYPEEKYITADGRTIYFAQYAASSGMALSSSIAGTLLETSILTGTVIPGYLLGLYSCRTGNQWPAISYGETSRGAQAASGQGRMRVYGWHSNDLSDIPNGWSPEWRAVESGVLKPLKTLETIAGKQLVEWCWPEESFNAP